MEKELEQIKAISETIDRLNAELDEILDPLVRDAIDRFSMQAS